MKKLKKHGGGGESSEEESNPTLFFFSFFLLSSLILSLSFSHPFPLSLSRPFHPSKQKIEQEGCVCQTRWVPPGPRAGVSNGASNAAGGAANNANSSNPFRLAVPCPADLSWHDVVCLVKDAQTMQQKQVLHPCSGIAVPGETVALMGPSGAGKLNCKGANPATATVNKYRLASCEAGGVDEIRPDCARDLRKCGGSDNVDPDRQRH